MLRCSSKGAVFRALVQDGFTGALGTIVFVINHTSNTPSPLRLSSSTFRLRHASFALHHAVLVATGYDKVYDVTIELAEEQCYCPFKASHSFVI